MVVGGRGRGVGGREGGADTRDRQKGRWRKVSESRSDSQ